MYFQKKTVAQSNPHANGRQPTGPITEAFRDYINNEIPIRFINTENHQFIPRQEVFTFFQGEIASVTEEQITERMQSSQEDLSASYRPRYERTLRQIIQEIVVYVVLSHRWDEVSGEPSYQDISPWRCSQFKKLVKFCKTARELGYKLAWVDTCCIDKTNAVELSEAINAMYKWYGMLRIADWARDSWFTRGWTLQELLAPQRIKFHKKTWQSFTPSGIENDRQSEDTLRFLENVTGISRAVLTADNSHGVEEGHTFWEIMSWASQRQTTHIEDKAYCLIGLFRVNLTITYGENQRAFSRLVEEIATRSPSWDVFAWCGRPSVQHFALPPSPASYPVFKTDTGKDRAGVQEFSITPDRLSLKSLPPIPMGVRSVAEPEEPGQPFRVKLGPRSGEDRSLGRYGDLLVECGTTHLDIMRRARQLSVCILNHHRGRRREQGKLIVGREYICLLLCSEGEEDDGTGERTWMKLVTNNLVRITCVGKPEEATQEQDLAGPNEFTLSLATTYIRAIDAF
ncbi:hypothetical protein V8E55_007531 [Tylopilus felleus]